MIAEAPIQTEPDTEKSAAEKAIRAAERKRNRMLKRMNILKRDCFRCRYCGKDLLASIDDFASATFDHVHPKAAGGTNHFSNLAASCGFCSSLKADAVTSSIVEARELISQRREEWRRKAIEMLAMVGVEPGDRLTAVPVVAWVDVVGMARQAEQLFRELQAASDRLQPQRPAWWRRLIRKPR